MCKSSPTPGLMLDYVPCAGGAKLIRVFGDDPCPVLPETLDGLPLVALGDYCFAPEQRNSVLPPEDTICHCVIPGAPTCDNRIGGGFLNAVTLPDSLRQIGSCAFYNCRSLTEIQLGSNIQNVGSDVFLNTFALTQLTVRAKPDEPCGLFEILNNIQTDVRVLFCPENTILAAATYPEYWMDVEESPAHIFLQTYDGQGFRYRQCFKNQIPEWDSYDAVLAQSCSSNPARIITQLALDRLRWPFALSDTARDAYCAYLKQNLSVCTAELLKCQDSAALSDLLNLDLMDEADLRTASDQARKAENALFAALLSDALAKKQPQKTVKKENRYDFDF